MKHFNNLLYMYMSSLLVFSETDPYIYIQLLACCDKAHHVVINGTLGGAPRNPSVGVLYAFEL